MNILIASYNMAAMVLGSVTSGEMCQYDGQCNVIVVSSPTDTTARDSDHGDVREKEYMFNYPKGLSESLDDGDTPSSCTGCTRAMRSMVAAFQHVRHLNSVITNQGPGTDIQVQHPPSPDLGASPVPKSRALSMPTSRILNSQDNDLKVKNIYRRPASRTGNRPRSSSFDPCQLSILKDRPRASSCYSRCQTQATDNNFSDDFCMSHTDTTGTEIQWMGDSSDVDNAQDNGRRRSTIDAIPTAGATNSECYLTVDSRPRATSLPPFLRSKLKRPIDALNPIYEQNTRACINDGLDVSNYSKKDPPNCALRNGQNLHDGDIKPDKNIPIPPIDIPNPVICIPRPCRQVSCDDVVCNVDGRVIQTIDSQGHTCQRFLLNIETNSNFIREKTSVKSLSSGTALIVILVPKVSRHSQSEPENIIAKTLPLPLTIDPFNVKASVQKSGVLTIVAPIVHI
jgi:hypothetical protein